MNPHQIKIAALAIASVFVSALPAITRSADRLPASKLRDGKDVRTAYVSIVASADLATVRVLSGGKESALGTVVDANGYILTKYSELRDPVTCRLNDGRTVAAKVVGHDPRFDMALLKVEADKLNAIVWAEGTIDPNVGHFVATAAPGDLPRAVGVISVPRHRVPPRSGVLGIQLEHADGSAKITLVFPGSGAAEAGLQVGDIVTRVADKLIDTRQTLIETIRQYKPGDAVPLKVTRGEKEMQITATLSTPGRIGSRSEQMNSMGGTISRRAADFPAVIQHDTALQADDCGGPLVDLSGKAIGINIARAGRTESYALPADQVIPLIADMKNGKRAPKYALPKAAE